MGIEHLDLTPTRFQSLHLTLDADKVVTVRATGMRDTTVMLTVLASGLEGPRMVPLALTGDTGTLDLRAAGMASHSWLHVTGYNLPSNTVSY